MTGDDNGNILIANNIEIPKMFQIGVNFKYDNFWYFNYLITLNAQNYVLDD